ncbi:hypothetical protein CLV59_109232 [Chitinophaga dinghuensis]|uniref:Uncharacterized protein n=1 Tax=Chitinophaga dinghuensis TaxID=1539050 RepID=A0A327VPY7_9BACT|nr:hypothetical protein [Chitinophaga dinghuensis]RAJ75618.1 hypothetical protein CLV59_109232 [Chitinophaga dinghuensis]
MNKLIYSGVHSVEIYIQFDGQFLLKQNEYLENIMLRTSLIRFLSQFELSVDEVKTRVTDEEFRVEDLIPFNEFIPFLIMDIKSIYWLDLVCTFLLNDQIQFKLNSQALDLLRDKDSTAWLPQKEKHLIWKLVRKIS